MDASRLIVQSIPHYDVLYYGDNSSTIGLIRVPEVLFYMYIYLLVAEEIYKFSRISFTGYEP